MLKNFSQFVCDECGALIESPFEGLVEWESKMDDDGRMIASGFRIVHNLPTSPLRGIKDEGCYRYSQKSPFREARRLNFIYPVSSHFIISFLNPGCFHSLSPESHLNSCRIVDFYEFADLARRLTIPYYEEARIYFEEALAEGINICDEETVFGERNLQRIIQRYSSGSSL